MSSNKKNKKRHPGRALWEMVNSFFRFFGTLLERLALKWRLSISFKITFAFIILTWFISVLFPIKPLFYLIGLPLIAIFGSQAVTRLLQPIQMMTETARRLSGNNLKERLNVQEAQDELRDLAETFNSMFDRIEGNIEDQKAFLSHASHELRTPLAVIRGYSDLLDRWGQEDPSVRAEAIQAIRSESESMQCLIEKLLLISRMDHTKNLPDQRLFSLDELIEEVLQEYQMLDQDRHLLEASLSPTELLGDRLLMKELLRILLDNARCYTPEGGRIRLELQRREHSIRFEVSDEGCGIPEEDLPHLFEPFFRADPSRNRTTGGTGLGLAIARRILDLHQASVLVQSKPGEGTRFQMIFPQ